MQRPSASEPSCASSPTHSPAPATLALPSADLLGLIAPHLIVPVVHSLVSVFDLGCAVDLRTIALHARNVEYEPQRCDVVTMCIREPSTQFLIFKSGQVHGTGASSEEDCLLAAKKCVRSLQKIGIDAKFKNFHIQNMVGSYDFGFPISLGHFYRMHHRLCSYRPGISPRLLYRMQDPMVSIEIFMSGHIVMAGAKTRAAMIKAVYTIYSLLQSLDKAGDIPW